MTEKIIDLSKYFKNHYDSWGRLYCVEYKGNPLELQNAIKELEQENARIKQQYNCYACDTCNGKEDYRNMKRHCENAIKTVQKLKRLHGTVTASMDSGTSWPGLEPWLCCL